METKQIVQEIDAEIDRLTQARNLLTAIGDGNSFGHGAKETRPIRAARKKRVLSPEARARIAAAQKKRWAKQKRAKTTQIAK